MSAEIKKSLTVDEARGVMGSKNVFGVPEFYKLQDKINKGYDTRKAVIFRWNEKRDIKISERDLELTKKNREVLVDRPETVIIIEGRKSAKESPISLNALTEIFKSNVEARKREFSIEEPGLKEKVLNGGKAWYEREEFANEGVRGGINLVTLNAVQDTNVESWYSQGAAEIIIDRAVVALGNDHTIDDKPIRAREMSGDNKSVFVASTEKGYKITKGDYYKASEDNPGVATQR